MRLRSGCRDPSIMPDCVRANTNVPTVMIGERIADFILAGLLMNGLLRTDH